MADNFQDKLKKDAKDLQKKVEESVNEFKTKLEQGYEITSKFYADYIERQASFTGEIIEANIKNGNSLTSIKSISEAIQNSTDHIEEVTKKYKDHYENNTKAFQAYYKKLQKLSQPATTA